MWEFWVQVPGRSHINSIKMIKFLSLVAGIIVIWALGSFITFDMLWFIHSVIGRLIALIGMIGIINTSLQDN